MARHAVPPLRIVPTPEEACCLAAARFRPWLDDLLAGLAPAGSAPTPLAINQAKVRFLDQFWLERGDTEVGHRDRLTGPGGQSCVLTVFLDGLARLRDIEGSVAPPQLTAPPKPARKPAKPAEPYLPPEVRLPEA